MTATLSIYSEHMPKLSEACQPFREICAKLEPHIQLCQCGGAFKKGASPRCPHCKQPLSAVAAATYIERDAPGTNKGWVWQRNWYDTYCIVIDNQLVGDNLKT